MHAKCVSDWPSSAIQRRRVSVTPCRVFAPSNPRRHPSLKDDYGAELAGVVQEAVLGAWRGPVSSVYGLHFVKVIATEAAYVPPLDVIGAEVRADRLREIRKELREERMAALREAYRITVERAP